MNPDKSNVIKLRVYKNGATPSLSVPVDVLIAAGIPVDTKFFRVSVDTKNQSITYKPIIFGAQNGCPVCDGTAKQHSRVGES